MANAEKGRRITLAIIIVHMVMAAIPVLKKSEDFTFLIYGLLLVTVLDLLLLFLYHGYAWARWMLIFCDLAAFVCFCKGDAEEIRMLMALSKDTYALSVPLLIPILYYSVYALLILLCAILLLFEKSVNAYLKGHKVW